MKSWKVALLGIMLSLGSLAHAESTVSVVSSGAWEVDPGVSWSGFELPVNYFVFDEFAVGLQARRWSQDDAVEAFWGFGIDWRYYFLLKEKWASYVGGAAYGTAARKDLIVSPEVGVKAFVRKDVAIGVSYDFATPMGLYLFSVDGVDGWKNRHTLSARVSIFL